MADVRSMFYQVRVPEADRDLLRFLWWPGGDVSAELKDFRMKVHIFGAASSPSCSNFALRRTAEDSQSLFSTEVTDTARSNFYVDDCLRSAPTVEEARTIATEVQAVCARGGFHLTKFVSNKEGVLDEIPPQDRDDQSEQKELDLEERPKVKKALGVKWNMVEDTFGFCVNLREMKTVTRRQILSIIGAVYDPLGIAGPITLSGKLILQELIAMKIGWDETIPESQEQTWTRWLQDLSRLEDLEVRRSLKPEGFGPIVPLSKSRVAPLKRMTVPRLELAAATVAVRLNAVITRELEIPIDQVTFWTDSTTVLRYLNNVTARYQIYVANRLAIIKDESSPSQWRFVRSEENPADDASRGVKAGKLNKERWINGPEFLKKEESEWPSLPDGFEEADEHDAEVIRPRACYATGTQEQSATDRLLQHYSDWHRLRKAVAWMLRCKKYLQVKMLNAGREGEAPVT